MPSLSADEVVRSTDQLPPVAVTVVENTTMLAEFFKVTSTDAPLSAVPWKMRVESFVIKSVELVPVSSLIEVIATAGSVVSMVSTCVAEEALPAASVAVAVIV